MDSATEGLINDPNTICREKEDPGIIFENAEEDYMSSVSVCYTRHYGIEASFSETDLQRAHSAQSQSQSVKIGTHPPHREAIYTPICWQG